MVRRMDPGMDPPRNTGRDAAPARGDPSVGTMTLSGNFAQGSGKPRDAAPQPGTMRPANSRDARSPAMAAMPIRMVVVYRVLATTLHHCAAGLAELRKLCRHARRDLRDVRNDVGAQPHGVARASLLGIGAALSVGPVKAAKQCADQQCQPANVTNGPHLYFSSGL
jgi:hypothetical protein